MKTRLARRQAFSAVSEGSGLRWIGPGSTAFLGAFGFAGECPPERVAPRLLGPEDGRALSGSSADAARELFRYFARGGRAAWILDDSRLKTGGEGWNRLGEYGEPGSSTGLYALADMEDVGTIAVLGKCSEAQAEEILSLASCRDDLLFLFEASEEALRPLERLRSVPAGGPSDSSALRILGRNVAALVLRGSPEPEEEPGCGDEPSLGDLAAFLEAWDFQPEPPFLPRGWEPPIWLPREEALYLCAFRRSQGLERSIELGTRWVIFDLGGPLLCKALEREIVAFLRELGDFGLLESAAREEAFAVECVPLEAGSWGSAEEESARVRADAAASQPPEVGISIRVRVRLAEPYGSALARGRSMFRREDRAAGDAGSG